MHHHPRVRARVCSGTPKLQGRISLNPIDHLDPMGTIMMVISSISGFGIGWGRPVRVNPYNFRSPRWDNLRVSLWGPLSNILTAAVFGLSIRYFHSFMSPSAMMFVIALTKISLGLAFFNLIPIGPLDGSHILAALLPREKAIAYEYFMARYGLIIFLGVIFIRPEILWALIGPPRDLLLHLFTGY